MSGRACIVCALLLITVTIVICCSTSPGLHVWQSEPGVIDRSLTIELRSIETGTESVRIHGDSIENATFTSNARLTAAGRILSLTEMYWFSNWANGWTEARLSATRELLLSPNGRGWSISVLQPPQIGDPVAASVRYFDDYLTGERALEEFTHRWDRILAVVGVLKQNERWFENAVAPRQPGRQSAARSYLRAIRNSGTMLRDFEECLGLWRIAFGLDELWSRRIEGLSFTLITQNPPEPALDSQGRAN